MKIWVFTRDDDLVTVQAYDLYQALMAMRNAKLTLYTNTQILEVYEDENIPHKRMG